VTRIQSNIAEIVDDLHDEQDRGGAQGGDGEGGQEEAEHEFSSEISNANDLHGRAQTAAPLGAPPNEK
jgi:hypothetical protein